MRLPYKLPNSQILVYIVNKYDPVDMVCFNTSLVEKKRRRCAWINPFDALDILTETGLLLFFGKSIHFLEQVRETHELSR